MTLGARAVEEHRAIQKIPELDALVNFLKGRPFKMVLEVGTHLGGTFWLWCQLAQKTAMLITIDIAEYERFEPEHAGQKLHYVIGDSHALGTRDHVIGLLHGRQLDLLFIDGHHAYNSVKQDYFHYALLVKPGGVIVLHDIAIHDDPDVHVAKFWDEIKQIWRGEVHEFIAPEGQQTHSGMLAARSAGIGVLVKP